MDGRDQGRQKEVHQREGIGIHPRVLSSTTSPNTNTQQSTAPHATRLLHVPISSGSHEQSSRIAPPTGSSYILPSTSLTDHIARSASTSGAGNSTLSRIDSSPEITDVRYTETTATRLEMHHTRLPPLDGTSANAATAASKLPPALLPGATPSFPGYGTHQSPAYYTGSQYEASSYDANLTMPASPPGGNAVRHRSHAASQAPNGSSYPSKREGFAACGSDPSYMSMNSSMMSMDFSYLQTEDFVRLLDLMNSDDDDDDIDDNQSSDFTENVSLRDDEETKACKSTGTDPSCSRSQDEGRRNEQISEAWADDQTDTYDMSNPPATSPLSTDIAKTNESPLLFTKTKTKRKPKRILDESRAIEPTDDDILLGRGGFTIVHPGNIRFREKALELSPWYESCSKEEKYHVSNVLINSIKGEGRRFLERGSNGLWYEVIGNGVRKKASQLMREPYIKESKRRTL
ncbi:hypothetical protein ACHAXA_011229 [Cyclostephanos tholiformis]|uniref:DUF6824 domain-containing protein n=1 Tax=Cyclostephanos tholiformis TaxID=382380 RepID=A0ABD3SPX1_9STRA